MPKYIVKVKQTHTIEVEVEADTPEMAEDMAVPVYENNCRTGEGTVWRHSYVSEFGELIPGSAREGTIND